MNQFKEELKTKSAELEAFRQLSLADNVKLEKRLCKIEGKKVEPIDLSDILSRLTKVEEKEYEGEAVTKLMK
jgi:hypothetical protein